jgi:uncharacterized membrane-anchored protein
MGAQFRLHGPASLRRNRRSRWRCHGPHQAHRGRGVEAWEGARPSCLGHLSGSRGPAHRRKDVSSERGGFSGGAGLNKVVEESSSKVPAVTLGFWIIKIAATTLGETGGDAVTMTMKLGYLIGTVIFGAILIAGVGAQIAAKRFHPFLYWGVIIATTTVGTTLADLVDRSLGIGYLGGASILLALVFASLGLWYKTCGSVSVDTVAVPKVELFYWATILFSQTLGTALGDWLADDTGLGYEGGALVFAAGLAAVVVAFYFSKVSRTLLFWAAFILTRPLGATVGDLLDKPPAHGGLGFGRFSASAVLLGFIVVCILVIPQSAGQHPGASRGHS